MRGEGRRIIMNSALSNLSRHEQFRAFASGSFRLQDGLLVICSIFFDVTDLLVGFFKGRVCASFTQAQSEDEGEGVDEEKDPESNNLDKEPFGTVLLDVHALLAIFAEVGHVHNSVGDEAEQSVGHGDVPHNGHVRTDANNRE